jgi:hypothetical protein
VHREHPYHLLVLGSMGTLGIETGRNIVAST